MNHREAVRAAAASVALVESSAKTAMLAALGVSASIAGGRIEDTLPPLIIARQLRVIQAARQKARERSAFSFQAETGLEEAKLAVPSDIAESRRAAEGIAVRVIEGGPYRTAHVAVAEMAPAVELTATTEVHAAWNAEWRRLASYWNARDVLLIHTWNAESDACDKCHALHSVEAVGDDDFPEGDPPLHPRCRCRIDTRVP